MQQFIQNLTEQYLSEARKSPLLCEDMDHMEQYLSESYSNRSFIELIQNADDASSSKILINIAHGNLYVANNGRIFSQEDISAICRSGSSTKTRGESIGYRGVGFKSTTSFSTKILISSGSINFAFSKKLVANALGVDQQNVPTIRVPFFMDSLPPPIASDICQIKKAGYSTIFTFQGVNTSLLLNELDSLSAECLLFLRKVEQIEITANGQSSYLSRVVNQNNTPRQFVETDDSRKNLRRKWCVISIDSRPSIAFIEREGQLINYDSAAVFHSYLPTMDLTGFNFRVNGDFSTEPSRKHIVIDNRTKIEIERIGKEIAQIVEESVSLDDNECGIWVRSILDYRGHSQSGAMLYESIISKLKNDKWLFNVAGDKISSSEARLLPMWASSLSNSIVEKCDKNIIKVKNSQLVQFFHLLEVKEVEPSFFFNLLKDPSKTILIDQETSINILLEYANRQRMDSSAYDYHLMDLFVKTNTGGVSTLSDALSEDNFKGKIMYSISKQMDPAFIQWINKQLGLSNEMQKGSPINSILRGRNRIVKNWQSAESICVAIEQAKGNIASDESKSNVGYDVLSIEPNGRKKYIEVKMLESEGLSFTMTNNEYSTAHLYGENYYLCLVVGKDNNPSVLFIQDPINHLHLEKRVKVWEWLCTEYEGKFDSILI